MRFLALSVLIIFIFGSASGESGLHNEGIPDLPVYSYTWRMAEFLSDSSYDAYRHDDGRQFRNLLSFSEKLRSSEALSFVPYTCNFVELLNTAIPEQCMVNYGTEFAGESVYEIGGEPAAAAEALQVTGNFFDMFPLQISEGRGFTDDDYGFLAKGGFLSSSERHIKKHLHSAIRSKDTTFLTVSPLK